MLTLLFLWKTIQTQKTQYLVATGISFGLAVGSKWTAGLILPLFLFLLFKENKTTTQFIAQEHKKFWTNDRLEKAKALLDSLPIFYCTSLIFLIMAYGVW